MAVDNGMAVAEDCSICCLVDALYARGLKAFHRRRYHNFSESSKEKIDTRKQTPFSICDASTQNQTLPPNSSTTNNSSFVRCPSSTTLQNYLPHLLASGFETVHQDISPSEGRSQGLCWLYPCPAASRYCGGDNSSAGFSHCRC